LKKTDRAEQSRAKQSKNNKAAAIIVIGTTLHSSSSIDTGRRGSGKEIGVSSGGDDRLGWVHRKWFGAFKVMNGTTVRVATGNNGCS
jgi:hypothetical protein